MAASPPVRLSILWAPARSAAERASLSLIWSFRASRIFGTRLPLALCSSEFLPSGVFEVRLDEEPLRDLRVERVHRGLEVEHETATIEDVPLVFHLADVA